MKIVYVITRADAVGGASVHVRDLAQAMLERGHEAVVLVGGAGPVTEQLTRAGVPFRSLRFLKRSIHPVSDFLALRELAAAVRDLQPDLVSTHTAKAGWLGRAASARCGLPAIYTPHGWPIADRISPAHGVIFRFAERTAARWGTAVICVCESERELALRNRIAPAAKLHVVHNGVQDVPAAPRKGGEAGPVRIISVARFEPPKDHTTLLHALGTLRSQQWQLDLIGDGPLEPEMRRLAGTLGVAGHVHFLGYQADPARFLARAEIFVLSSRSEGFPRSVLEAMRAGLPVVASNVGGVNEAVSHGRNGLLVSRGNVDALAAALQELIADAARRQRLGTAARLAYESRFRLERMVAQTLAVYVTVLDRNSGTRSND